MPDTLRSILLFLAAAVLEIGGAWLIWQGVREHRGIAWVGVGIVALAGSGGLQLGAGARHIDFVATTTVEQALGDIQLSLLNRQ